MQETTPEPLVRQKNTGQLQTDQPAGVIGSAVSRPILLNADWIILLSLLIVTGVAYLLHWSFTVDDAAISFSYARNFAHGFGLGALYPGAPRVEGYSNLLWVILLGAGTRLGFGTILISKVLGLVFALGAILVLFLSLRAFLRNRWLLIGLVLLPMSLTFTFWSVSGLENSLYAFLILLSVYLLLQEDRHPAWIPFGSALVLVLVGMTRPDGLIYALAALGYKIIQLAVSAFTAGEAKDKLKHSTINLIIWFAIFVGGYGLFKIWHYGYFAAFWPNPIYAKAGWYGRDLNKVWYQPEGWTYLRGYFRSFGAVWMVAALIFGGLVSLRGRQRIFPIFALAALALPLYTFDWMVNYRFVYPFVPFEVALLVLAADQLWTWITDRHNTPLWLRIGSVALAAFFAFTVARYAWANLRLTQRQLACGYTTPMAETRCLDGKMYWSMGEVNEKYAELQGYAQQAGLKDPLVMIPDIGATSYTRDLRILDIAGLADYQLARIREGSLLKQAIFQEQRPDLIMIYGQWTRRTDLTSFSAFKENYLPIEEGQDKDGTGHGTYIRKDLLVQQASTSGQDRKCELAQGLFLVNLPASIQIDGNSLGIDSNWQIDRKQTQDWNISVRLLNPAGEPLREEVIPLGYGWYPTSIWVPGESIRQYIPLPDGLPAGSYKLEISAPDLQKLSGIMPTCSAEISILPETKDKLTAGQNGPGRGNDLTVLLASAQDAWQRGDLAGMLSAIRQAASLRGRQHVSEEWVNLGQSLRLAADREAKQNNWENAYSLYFAASLANPEDAWAQHGLEAARNQVFSKN